MHKHKQHQCKSRSNWKNKMFREGVSDRDITYAFSFELEMRMEQWHRFFV